MIIYKNNLFKMFFLKKSYNSNKIYQICVQYFKYLQMNENVIKSYLKIKTNV